MALAIIFAAISVAASTIAALRITSALRETTTTAEPPDAAATRIAGALVLEVTDNHAALLPSVVGLPDGGVISGPDGDIAFVALGPGRNSLAELFRKAERSGRRVDLVVERLENIVLYSARICGEKAVLGGVGPSSER